MAVPARMVKVDWPRRVTTASFESVRSLLITSSPAAGSAASNVSAAPSKRRNMPAALPPSCGNVPARVMVAPAVARSVIERPASITTGSLTLSAPETSMTSPSCAARAASTSESYTVCPPLWMRVTVPADALSAGVEGSAVASTALSGAGVAAAGSSSAEVAAA